ncbi:uncharacterized protein BCR38DRAFT_114860 [Pseudomassariella vexata]|uniref:Uncharacterized protein n=1 Tax=Pseudomassariella vexata TaxID=1141098 RepID=A0A1Y2DD38_9PEZI|nr:uncharacterized protein BCR38DRAFT_114860 [Pseudomassariella vexata]ORY56605.1 hypothetical protein BCR38DRAFT_114860 [Pseudomassariella vexata]
MSSSDLGKSKHGIPDVVMEHIDRYVDSLAPQIQPQIATEIDTFQQKTIDSLDDQIVNAFRSLFNKGNDGKSSGGASRSLDASAPDSYGTESLPFADEIAAFTRSLSKATDGFDDDLRGIFDLTEGGGESDRGRELGDSSHHGAIGFLSAALEAVTEHTRPGSGGKGGQQVSLDGLLGVLSSRVKEASRNPEEKARVISPEIKEKVGVILRKQHAPLAEQFTRIALDHIKRWLRGNTSTRDLGDGLKGEISDLVSGIAGMFSHKSKSDDNTREIDRDENEETGNKGISGMISNKLSTGLAKVHREVRLEFRTILGGIEKSLFESLPDDVQGPLEKVLGGNPFDSSLNSSAQAGSRGFGDDIKSQLVDKIRRLVRKVQETLRESILSMVNGGHRKFERASWLFVQDKVELKVRKYLPDVRIRVPDDVGNEGVSVGAPQTNMNLPPSGGSSQ